MERFRLPAAALAAGAALAGCGGSDEQDQAPTVPDAQRAILSTIDELQSASRRGDAERICDRLFTESLAKSIQKSSKQTCEDEVRQTLTSPDAQISVGRQIEVKGARATAVVREQNGNTSTLFLVKDGDRWMIERLRPLTSR